MKIKLWQVIVRKPGTLAETNDLVVRTDGEVQTLGTPTWILVGKCFRAVFTNEPTLRKNELYLIMPSFL